MVALDLEKLVRPQTVAVIGASKTRGTLGNNTIKNFADLKFAGKVFGVNPRYEEVEGFPCYPSLSAVPDSIDLALIVVSSALVESAIRECTEKSVKFIIIFSSGFAEMGAEGRRKQDTIKTLCRENGIRVLGPNTIGIYNFKNQTMLTFSPKSLTTLLPGDVGIVSQSGIIGGLIARLAVDEEVGFSYMVATGNQMDLTSLDILDFFVEDGSTKIIVSYMEEIPDGTQLKEAAVRALGDYKPIIVYKSGSSDAGKKAAMSHTASMTGSSQVFEMVAKQYGITAVNELEDMIDAMKAFRSEKRSKGNRVATVVSSGAIGIMLVDKLADLGHEMAVLSEATKNRLAEVVPGYCSIQNPVDIGATFLGIPGLYKHCIETLAAAEEVDAVIAHLTVGNDMGGLKYAQDILDVAGSSAKPIIALGPGTEKLMGDVRRFLTKKRVPIYSSVRSASQAAYYLWNYEKAYAKRQELIPGKAMGIRQYDGPIPSRDCLPVTEPEIKRLLNQFNIPVPRGGIGKNLEELMQAARDLVYPLVAKIVSPDIKHKSDMGGVIINIKDKEALVSANEAIISNARENAPSATIDGILIEEMVPGPFLEAIVGVTRDPVFGPVVLCGLGGIYVEVMKDFSQRLAPVSEGEALEMIRELKSYPLFTGFRKGRIYDVKALAKTLAQVSQMAISIGDAWTDLEINPLIVRAAGEGVTALDALITAK